MKRLLLGTYRTGLEEQMELEGRLLAENADSADGQEGIAAFIGKRAPQFVAEALECHGGNGFIADHLMERLYREAPLNGIWEGTGNVICLDVIRAAQREPACADAFLAELREAKGADRRFDAYLDRLEPRLADLPRQEGQARRTVEMMAYGLQASLLLRYSAPAVADAFCGTRLEGEWGSAFGTLPGEVDTGAIV